MTALTADPGSFRDPSNRVYRQGGRILRAVLAEGAPNYEAVRDSGFLKRLTERDMLIGSQEVDAPPADTPGEPTYLLEHPRLPFVSYPYEWPFALHKRAALFHLDLQMAALEEGFALSDATAYNVQFIGTRPIFIDHLSLRPYVEGELWMAHRQFCMQFLNPLILWAKLGIAPHSWFRGSLEGIAPEDLAALLRGRDRLSWTVLSHVTGQAWIQKRVNSGRVSIAGAANRKLPRPTFRAMLLGLKSYISKLLPARERTLWQDYACDNSYQSAEAGAKHDFVRRAVSQVLPAALFDLGCNSGDYSRTAIEAGAGYVVGFDFDHGALEMAVGRAHAESLPFLPLWLDAANPSPSQGWAQAERKGLTERSEADALIALAFIHHLALGRNVPLGMAVDWLISLAPTGVIEFPPKSDPMVRQLLTNRADIFPSYTEECFLAEVSRRARIADSMRLSKGGRILVHYDRR